VLCEARSASLYKTMWEKIVSLAPGLNKNLKFIMADYEKAAILAMSNSQQLLSMVAGFITHRYFE